ncbi:hypothetical protein PN36_23790 [Candidatus Thiomargarita nelsonii]|uniref:Uncharacterized protein n=1 Tax=Candidatus Thiomargarita nelsonii TaxID=1003181 RepID=A0A0A6P617_9GAMM|nr:hypothetical protein PN36_23790 [Candidatus Thiomargarita nelsonii]
MNTQLRSLIDTALKLEPLEQLGLIQAISQSLQHNYLSSKSHFGQSQTTHSKPVKNIADLRADFWPSEESADDIIKYTYQQRYEECLQK